MLSILQIAKDWLPILLLLAGSHALASSAGGYYFVPENGVEQSRATAPISPIGAEPARPLQFYLSSEPQILFGEPGESTGFHWVPQQQPDRPAEATMLGHLDNRRMYGITYRSSVPLEEINEDLPQPDFPTAGVLLVESDRDLFVPRFLVIYGATAPDSIAFSSLLSLSGQNAVVFYTGYFRSGDIQILFLTPTGLRLEDPSPGLEKGLEQLRAAGYEIEADAQTYFDPFASQWRLLLDTSDEEAPTSGVVVQAQLSPDGYTPESYRFVSLDEFDYLASDFILNRLFQVFRRQLDETQWKKLAAEQQTWAHRRDRQCRAKPEATPERWQCLARTTEKRIEELRPGQSDPETEW